MARRNKKTEGMTVRELIEVLEEFEDDDLVFFSYGYGDHPNTEVAEPVNHAVPEKLKYSSYHQLMAVVDEEDMDDGDEFDVEAVVLHS